LLAAGNASEIAAAWVSQGAAFGAADLKDALDRLFRDAATRMVPVTDLAALLASLKQRGLKLGIASSDSEAAIRDSARHFGMERHLDFVSGYDSGHGHKPQPGMFHAFCAATGLAPNQVAMVGDNRHDLEMGRRGGAGLKVAVLTGSGTRDSLMPHCDLCLASIAELPAHL
jgi:phosphoglycolate phosphatase